MVFSLKFRVELRCDTSVKPFLLWLFQSSLYHSILAYKISRVSAPILSLRIVLNPAPWSYHLLPVLEGGSELEMWSPFPFTGMIESVSKVKSNHSHAGHHHSGSNSGRSKKIQT
jgi:hypothetical protein